MTTKTAGPSSQQHQSERLAVHSDTSIGIDLLTPHKDPSNPFAFTPAQLSSLVDPKNLDLLVRYGGLDGVARGLHLNNIHRGLCPTDQITSAVTLDDSIDTKDDTAEQQSHPFGPTNTMDCRTTIFGPNVLPETKAKNVFQLMLLAFRDKTLILLSVASVISLVIGIYETVSVKEYDSQGNQIPGLKWVEGVAIVVAIIVVVLAGSINDFQKDKQFRKLNAKKEDRLVKSTRNGIIEMISIHDVKVGDILHLEPGDIVPADGIFIDGHNLRCDESSATGESDAVRKADWRVCRDAALAAEKEHSLPSSSLPDPFIISGTTVLEGVGTCLVISVGIHSYHGRTLMALRTEDEMTPLQVKLNGLAGAITKCGSAAAVLMLLALLIRYFVGFRNGVPTDKTEIVGDVMSILVLVVTVIVVAVPEGLPLAVTLALAYATQRMLKDNNLVRVLASCETMGNATTVCSDKTGTLTQNKMTVVAGTLGVSFRFGRTGGGEHTSIADGVDIQDIPRDAKLVQILNEGIAVNSTVFTGKDETTGQPVVVGNKTETALVNFGAELGSEPFERIRQQIQVEQVYPFSSDRKAMATVVCIENEKLYRLHVKGASEIVLDMCSSVLTLDGVRKELTKAERLHLTQVIQGYASQSLRTLAIAYRDYHGDSSCWSSKTTQKEDTPFNDLVEDRGLTLIGIIGIEDPLREGVKEAVRACQLAGVFVRMVTGDNVMTAKSIAQQCGIYTTGGVVLEGPVFRRMSEDEKDAVIPRLQVLARSSPEDKRILVERLKQLGETVAVTGDGTNDGPALKLADVGFSMGIAGTDVAKEASSIILMDDNFASIVKAIMWGRCVNDAVSKFLQFQLTVNVTAIILTFISGVASEKQKSVLTTIQLLWVNLIMDTLAALALATDPPTEELLNRNPTPKNAPLITLKMWKMIIGQAIFQVVVTFVLLYGRILNYEIEDVVLQTIVFNTFVFCQLFNEVNCRRIDSKLNVFHKIWNNKFFIVVFFLCVGLQAVIVNVGSIAFQVTAINGPSWALSIIVGMFSLPVGALVRLIPDHWFAFLFRNPETRRRYLGEDYDGPIRPSVYMAGSDPDNHGPDSNVEAKKPTITTATPDVVVSSA
ncbi:PMCA-type calcium-translocating P-type ATPase [Dichotomocladium elegans]|nr:PMCA-type calcium-translocating P-type ATPase [Dichotomocladium elegans]